MLKPTRLPCPQGYWPVTCEDRRELHGYSTTLVGERIFMLHSFIKKTEKTPNKELKIARRRLIEVLDDES